MDYWKTYEKAYQATNPELDQIAYEKASFAFLDPFLPTNKNAAIIDIGCGAGIFLYYLYKRGFENLEGIDVSPGQITAARKILDGKTRLYNANGDIFFDGKTCNYDQISMFDVIEHVPKVNMESFLKPIIYALKPGGCLMVRTPNMANIFGAYSRYLDITHEIGFTEQSLNQLMLAMGASRYVIIDQNRFTSWKNRLSVKIRNSIYAWVYRQDLRTVPTVFDKNIFIAYYF